MTPRGRRLARWALIGLLVVIAADEVLPTELFVIAAVVVALGAAAALSMHWYEQAVDVETENMQLRFAVIGLEDEVRDLVRDNDAMLCRLGEVLDEHALCPVPVDDVEVVIAQPVDMKIVGGSLSKLKQRKAGPES